MINVDDFQRGKKRFLFVVASNHVFVPFFHIKNHHHRVVDVCVCVFHAQFNDQKVQLPSMGTSPYRTFRNGQNHGLQKCGKLRDESMAMTVELPIVHVTMQ